MLIKTEFIKVLPPATLIQPCPLPNWQGTTNHELIDYSLELQSVIKQCDNDKRLLREFINDSGPNIKS